MLNIKVQSTSVEENFVFGSPPLLNGFAYNTCRTQEGLLKVNHECFSYNMERSFDYDSLDDVVKSDSLNGGSSPDMKRKPYVQQPKFPVIGGYGRSHANYQNAAKNGCRKIESVTENLNQLNLGNIRGSHVDNGIKILEHAGLKVQQTQQPCSETVFKKRKDLRVLKLALSNERFREVAVKFGDGDEGGREISESVHRTLRNENTSQVTCLYCKTECQVYENFPIVDGTLFLTPVNRSRDCLKFVEKTPSKIERYLGFVCVNCMEGKSKTLCCSSCHTQWKGSFFQVGTMYSYDILSATPCCERAVACRHCDKPVIDILKGEASTLYFSNFSVKSTCPHCSVDDFHFVKPLSMFTLQDVGIQ